MPTERRAAENKGLICGRCRGPLRDDERALARFPSGYQGRVCDRCARKLAAKAKRNSTP